MQDHLIYDNHNPYRRRSPPPLLHGVFLAGDQQSHLHILHVEELIELANAQMGRAITHTSTLSWVGELLLQNTAITSALLTSQGG